MALSLISSISRIFCSHRLSSWFLLAALVPFFLPFVFLCVPLLMLFLAPASCIVLFILLVHKVQVIVNRYPRCQHRDKGSVLSAENLGVEPAVSLEKERGDVSEYEGEGVLNVGRVNEHLVDSSYEGPASEAVEEAALDHNEQEHMPLYAETPSLYTPPSGQEGLLDVAQQQEHLHFPTDIPDAETATWPPITVRHPHHHDGSSSSSSEGPAAKQETQKDFEPEYESFALDTSDQGIVSLSECVDEGDDDRRGVVVGEHWEDAREKGCEESITNIPPSEEPEIHGYPGQELPVHGQVVGEDEAEGSLIKPFWVESERPEEPDLSPAVSHIPSSQEESELITQSEKEPYAPRTIEEVAKSEEIEQAQRQEKPEQSLVKSPLWESVGSEEFKLLPAVPHPPSSHEESELITRPEEEPYEPHTIEGVVESEENEQAQHGEKPEGSLIKPPWVESESPEELGLSPVVPHTPPSHEESELITRPEKEPYTPDTIEGFAKSEEFEQAQHEEKPEQSLIKPPWQESVGPGVFELSPAVLHTPSSHEESELITQSEKEPYALHMESEEIEQAPHGEKPEESLIKPPLVESERPEDLERAPAVPHTPASHEEQLIVQPEEETYVPHRIEGVVEVEQAQHEEKPGETLMKPSWVESEWSKDLERSPAVPHTPSSHEESQLITQPEEEPYLPHTLEGVVQSEEIEQPQHEEKPYTPHAIESFTESEEIEQAQPEEKPCTPHRIEGVTKLEEIEPAAQTYGLPGLEETGMEATAKQVHGDTEGLCEEVPIVEKDKDDVSWGETSSAGGLVHERPTHTDVETQDKVDEEQILADLSAIEKIVGYSGGPHASIMEQIDALYIFLGMEPLYWAVEVNDLERAKTEIELLKVVVGVK